MQATEPYYILPVKPTEQSQADKGIDHTLVTCDCGTTWRSRVRSLCPTCGQEGNLFALDARQNSNLFVAVYDQEVTTPSYTKQKLKDALEKFRALLRENAQWYDRNSRKMIQACHTSLCLRGGTSSKAALAMTFFEEEFACAPEEPNTFCSEKK